jgi:hypothetical protein
VRVDQYPQTSTTCHNSKVRSVVFLLRLKIFRSKLPCNSLQQRNSRTEAVLYMCASVKTPQYYLGFREIFVYNYNYNCCFVFMCCDESGSRSEGEGAGVKEQDAEAWAKHVIHSDQ